MEIMKKAKYVLVNSKDEYFVEINKLNKGVFTKDKKEARKMFYSDTEDLIPYLEKQNGVTIMAEQI